MNKNGKETDSALLNLINPLLDDDSTEAADSGSETGQPGLSYQTKYKTEVKCEVSQKCRYWVMGLLCPFGESCSFAHGMYELREKAHISKKYKTKVCLNFEKTGCCRYGDRCQFLHLVTKPKLQRKKSTLSGFYGDLLEQLGESQLVDQPIPVRYSFS